MRLHIRPETLCSLITLAREFQAKEAVVFPETPGSPTEDWALQTLASHAEDPAVAEFNGIVEDMSERQRAELVALLWLGRGDVSLEDWEVAVDDAIGDYSLNAASYVLAHPLVSDYLEEALLQHDISCND